MSYQETVWNYLRAKGLNEKSTASIMGNIEQESGFDANLIEVGNGIGFGLCQWSFERRTQLEAYGTDINHQLDFLWSELTGENTAVTGASFQWIEHSGYLNYSDFMSGNGTIEELTASFCFNWERPNAELANLANRQSSALTYYNQFTGTTGGGGTDPTPTTGNCKLIYPYWYASNIKISYVLNDFVLMRTHGNVVLIKNPTTNRLYYVNKSSIKMI